MPVLPPGHLESQPLNYQHLRAGFQMQNVPPETVRKGRELYYGLTQWMDGQVGEILQALEAHSGVAVADQPTGPYRFIESFRPNAGHWPVNVPAELKKPLSAEEQAHVRKLHLGGGPVPNFPEKLLFRRDFAGGQMARDMTLFVDDDGAAFHIYASGSRDRARTSCRCPASLGRSSSWPTSGGPRTRLTAGISGCPSSSRRAGRLLSGWTSGT